MILEEEEPSMEEMNRRDEIEEGRLDDKRKRINKKKRKNFPWE